MGWKASMIIIENKENFEGDDKILAALDKTNFQFQEELSINFDFYQRDESICIGYYNNNIIILDDYQITEKSLERAKGLKLLKEEKQLVDLFPNAEILTVACHSATNYHGYSLIQNGKKVRLKRASSDSKLQEFGERFEEEKQIYKDSYQKNGQNYWKNEDEPDPDELEFLDEDDLMMYEDYTDDYFMEDFTFGIAKRRLKIRLDNSENDLIKNITFKKYINLNKKIINKTIKEEKPINNWLRFGLFFLIIIIWQVLKKTVFKG